MSASPVSLTLRVFWVVAGLVASGSARPAGGLAANSKILPVIDAKKDFESPMARGSAIVLNMCRFPVYITACYQPTSWAPIGACDVQQTIPPGEAYGETYWNQLNNGRSIAIYLNSVATGAITNPMQLEYTIQTDDATTFYDVSNFDGNPFATYGFDIWTTEPLGFRAHCPPPANDCPSVFPVSDPIGGDVHAISIKRDIGVTLCVT